MYLSKNTHRSDAKAFDSLVGDDYFFVLGLIFEEDGFYGKELKNVDDALL